MKKIIKSRVFCCLITVLVVGTVSVAAATYFPSNQVTYDNTASGLSSTNVQGAIDELYNECSSSISAGNYMYYAVNRYGHSGDFSYPTGGTLYKCNADGSSCNVMKSASSLSSIGKIYANSNYMYYTINDYGNYSSFAYPNGGTLYKCNIDGSSCNAMKGTGSWSNIEIVFVNNNYILYAINSYSNYVRFAYPTGGNLYRCNIDGSNCNGIKSASSSSIIS